MISKYGRKKNRLHVRGDFLFGPVSALACVSAMRRGHAAGRRNLVKQDLHILVRGGDASYPELIHKHVHDVW